MSDCCLARACPATRPIVRHENRRHSPLMAPTRRTAARVLSDSGATPGGLPIGRCGRSGAEGRMHSGRPGKNGVLPTDGQPFEPFLYKTQFAKQQLGKEQEMPYGNDLEILSFEQTTRL